MTDDRTMTPGPALAGPDGGPPLSVWVTAQRDARTQRRGRYAPESMAHPGKMLPAIAAAAITRYTAPGDLVADPMCGIGTTLSEAVYLGRDALGVEFEGRWARIAAANIDWARRHGAAGHAEVIQGDARQLRSLIPPAMAGTAALILTSPPYGPSIHGQVKAEARSGGGGVTKFDNTYGTDPANLASRRLDDLLAGFGEILAAARALLRPDGTVVITTRPWRQRGELVDFPGAVLAAGTAAGLIPAERCVALLAGIAGSRLIARPSFFQLDNTRKARAQGKPWHLIAHEDVIVFREPLPGSSPELKGPQREVKGAPRQLSHVEPGVAEELGAAALCADPDSCQALTARRTMASSATGCETTAQAGGPAVIAVALTRSPGNEAQPVAQDMRARWIALTCSKATAAPCSSSISLQIRAADR
jgi:modification methylase